MGDAFESHRTYRVTAEELKSYARQWDPHPYHLDEEHAKKTLVGQLFAPSMLTLSISTRLSHDTDYYRISTVAGLGIDEVRMLKPVLVDDQLKVKVTIISKRVSKSRSGLGIMTTKNEVINQNNDVVLSYSLSALVNQRAQ
ncbi:MaoC/PaaZ C-terminal domain-containing protein [Candidatus Entotheonella palauensis]|uniref:MaoC/PaaZ C-terminal domain-containing protein n=1 Tax=Candidatus Entotheonella palauensis TaxID=93172 RepID=UPI000B7F1622|nr:MaoC/PaaZ C-terminal domain-containing protein [Candidatus Entotheonella palauensis]